MHKAAARLFQIVGIYARGTKPQLQRARQGRKLSGVVDFNV